MNSIHSFRNVAARIYHLDKGQVVPPGRHRHADQHTVGIIAGAALVRVWSEHTEATEVAYYVLRAGEYDDVLPANQDHDIKAVEDGTIVITMIEGGLMAAKRGDPLPPPPVQSGVILVGDLE